jgi:hypothetical protein
MNGFLGFVILVKPKVTLSSVVELIQHPRDHDEADADHGYSHGYYEHDLHSDTPLGQNCLQEPPSRAHVFTIIPDNASARD